MDARLPVRAFFTDRIGGVSAEPFDQFNLAEHVGDEPSAVETNRAVVAERAGGSVVFMRPQHGAKVAVVEGSRVGGTCVIRGCVPKKLLMYAAQFGDAMREARGYGWTVAEPRFEMAAWAAAKAAETARLEGIYRSMLDGSNVKLIEGWAQFDGPHRVKIVGPGNEQVLTARHILIATGSAPVRDSIPGIEACATSDDLLDLAALPDRAAVIGGGYIALEFASMLTRLGVKVSVFYRDRLPLRGFDEMLRTAIVGELQTAGVELHPGSAPSRVLRTAGGLQLSLSEDRVLDFPWVLNATGRRPNSGRLNLASVGITPAAMGEVPIDAALQTCTPGIHAIGDVTNRRNLTPVAIAEGRALADALAELKAVKIAHRHAGRRVLGCDQTLERDDGRLFDQPGSALTEHLRALSGRTHRLHAAAVVAVDGQPIWRHIETVTLRMRVLSDTFITDYVAREGASVAGCVGGYRIEGTGVQLFDRIDGSYFAILGLPLLGLLGWLRATGAVAS